jgi:single-strand DNA-binding protein
MINKVILLGNVGKDPEVRYLDNDVAVANFPLATSERAFKTRDGQEVPERTEWHNIVAWRGLAKIAESYIKKGSQIYVEGKLRTRSYEQDGIKKWTTEIFADNIQLLGRKADNPASAGQDNSYAAKPSGAPAKSQNNQVQDTSNQGKENYQVDNAPDDDLPF